MDELTKSAKQEFPEGTVTFLFTDIEGSTELLRRLGDKYISLLEDQRRILRTIFAKWHGREVDTEGDAFFVSFPRATEAITAVVEAQKALANHSWPENATVLVRMGLHTGEPWTGAEGYVGMDVHRAARIAHVGHGGQVLLSETTSALVRSNLPAEVRLVDLGLHRLKDMEFPEHIRQLAIAGLPTEFPTLKSIQILEPATRSELEPPPLPDYLEGEAAGPTPPLFVGRERELEWLDQRLNLALQNKGGIVFVTGEAGIGKSALFQFMANRAAAANSDLLVTWGAGNALIGSGDAYLPFRQALNLLSGDVQRSWQSGLITTEQARRLWATIPLMGRVLTEKGQAIAVTLIDAEGLLTRAGRNTNSDVGWYNRLDRLVRRAESSQTDLSQDQLYQQCTNVLRTLSDRRPLLVLLDDLQWADGASLNLLFHLGRSLTDCRILIIGSFRPEEVALGRDGTRHPLEKVMAELRRLHGDIVLDLENRSETENQDFVDDLLDGEPNALDRSFRRALLAHTRGQPLFTVETLRFLQERGDLIKNQDGLWTDSVDVGWDTLPHRVEGVIQERIDRLEPELQDVLTTASVEGELFTTQVVAEVNNLQERTLLRWLAQDLERRHRLVKEQEEVDTVQSHLTRYRFSHALFRDYLYKRLGRGERRLLHGDIATALERHYQGQLEGVAVQLAHHFDQAQNHNKAYQYYTMVAESAARSYASVEAIANYTHAIKLAERFSPNAVTLAALHHGRGLSYGMVGEFEKGRSDYESALQIARAAGETEAEWRALLDLGRLWASRDYHQARDCFEAALDLARRINKPELLADSLNWMGNWHANDENLKRAVTYHKEALTILEELGYRRELANTLDLLGLANLLAGNLGTSVHYYDRAIALFRELDNRHRLVSSLIGRAANVSVLIGLMSVPVIPAPDATADFDEAVRIAGEIGSASEEAWADWALGMMHIVNGQFGRALNVIQSGLNIATEIGHREMMVGNLRVLGEWYIELFAPVQARGKLEDALTLAEELGSPTWIHILVGALTGAYTLLDDLKSAQSCLETVISTETPMDTLGKRYCWLRLAELALAQDDPALALDIIDRLIVSAPGMTPGRVVTYLWKLKADALVASGRVEDTGEEKVLSLLHAAIRNAEAAGERFLMWRLHASLGKLHRILGNQEAAEREFATARALIDELAATIPDESLRKGFQEGACSTLRLPT
jgi:class 3 adenylate cyclase/tetratricopeptide (TPR) repeat protein